MSSVSSSPRSRRLRIVFKIEQLLAFIALVVYALLVSVGQQASLLIIMLSVFTVGNLLVPLAFAARRLYANRPSPWNWIVFVPVQIGFGFLCGVASILLLQVTRLDTKPFWELFRQVGYLCILVVLISNVVLFGIERLKERNELLEQTVEKGSIALQEQEEELKRAREIQEMLLPSTLPQIPGAQISGAWQPARTVGGDYFDVIKFADNRVGICVGDVVGKGITAALLMANLQASFRALATVDATPQVVCTKLNNFLCANTATGKFVTFFYAVLDTEKRTLIYENAGHCAGLLLRADGTMESLAGGGAVLGALQHWVYTDHEVQLRLGDKLVLMTDGITEAEDGQQQEFGEDRVLIAIRDQKGDAISIQRGIMQRVTAFCDGNFRDDATVLVMSMT